MHVQPYLNFDGRCDEALEFYKSAIGAKVGMLLRFKEAPDKSMISPGSEEKVMHSAVQVGDSTVLMSDGRCTGKPNFQRHRVDNLRQDRGRGRQDVQRLGRGRQSNTCRSPRPSSRRNSAWSPINSVSAGWCLWQTEL